MCKYLVCFFYCFLFHVSVAQKINEDFHEFDAVWPGIALQLEQAPKDALKELILNDVESMCGNDFFCRFNTYRSVMLKLEEIFNLPLAVEIGHEMIALARQQEQLKLEALTHQNLSRYYSALGLGIQSAYHVNQAIIIYEQLCEEPALDQVQWSRLEQTKDFSEPEEILSEMEALLANALERGDSSNILHFHRRLIWYTIDVGFTDQAMKYIEALEEISVSKPRSRVEYGNLIATAFGRAEIALTQNDLDLAKEWFSKAAQLSREAPDIWREVYALLGLTNLELERNNASQAKAHLSRAQKLAEDVNLSDQLIRIYQFRTQIAESEGRYRDALEHLKQQRFHESKWDERNAGLDAQNYYLQLERDRMSLDKTNTELELDLKKAQLRYSIIIATLVVLLSLLLFIGWFVQRKRKRALAIQHDIIIHQKEELLSLDAAKSRFFANVSHELRTPLTLIQGPIQKVLNEGELNEQQTRLLQMVDHNTHQLKELVGDILDLQKLETSKMELVLRPVALTPFFRTLASQFESLTKQKQIEFSFESTIHEMVVGLIDTSKCRQVLNNLLSNAFIFTPSGKQIKVQLSLEGNEFQLQVSDTGPGVAEIDLPHVFDRFFQTYLPDKPAEGGTGIGLALCKEYAHLFGGNISVESILNERTTFTIIWPIELSEKSPEQIHEAIAPNSARPALSLNGSVNSNQLTILVVEDNAELQHYISLLLSDRFNVQTANNGREALEYIANGTHIDLVLSDLMMPVMDGYQLLDKLKSEESTRGIPVVMLTARAEARDKLKALRIGVDDYLLKPFDEEELLARIENLLQHKAARQLEMAEAPVPEKVTATPDQEWLEKFETYVQKHFADDALAVPDLALEFAMSESTLLRQLKKCTGLTPSQYLKEVRLDHARKLLEQDGTQTIAAIASAAGYSDTRSFSRVFKKRFGKLPSAI